jgi:Flp pilus assembly protein TadB
MTLARALGFRAMTPPASRLVRSMLALSCAAAMLLGAAAQTSAAEVKYQRESEQEWKSQLTSRQIATVTINKRAQSLRTTLKDGRYVLANYPKHQSPRVEAELTANHVPFTVLSKAQAAKLAKKTPVHHKLRYIAGGILLAVIVIVGAVLLIRRRVPAD